MHRVSTFYHRALPILPFFLSVVQIIFPANSLHMANLSGLPSIRSSTLLNGDAGNESISLARENGKRSTNREINPSAIPRQISSPSSKEREEESNTLREARENSSSIRSGFREEIGIERCLLVGGPDASSLSLSLSLPPSPFRAMGVHESHNFT